MSDRLARRGGDPAPVADVLARYLRSSGLNQKLRSPEIYQCWPEVAGPEAREHSRVVGFNNCILYVEVDSAPWLQLLAAFRKQELLRGLQDTLLTARVKDIKFRIGSSMHSAPAAEPGNHARHAAPAPSGRKPCRTKPQPPPTTRETSESCPA